MNPSRRFPRRAAWRAIDKIVQAAAACDPGHPSLRPELVLSWRQYCYIAERHNDFKVIYDAGLFLRDAIGSLR